MAKTKTFTNGDPIKRVRFIPVKDGDLLDLGDTGVPGVSGAHKVLGFKPGPGPQARGWLVVLVNESLSGHQPRKRRDLIDPKPR